MMLTDQRFGKRAFAKKRPVDIFFRGADLVRQALIVGQLVYQRQNRAGVAFNGRSDDEIR